MNQKLIFKYIKNPPEYSGAGIYEIKNIKTGRTYIGSSINIRNRIEYHEKAFQEQRCNNRFKEDIRQGALFSAKIIRKYQKRISNNELEKGESEEIEKRGTIENGYNVNKVYRSLSDEPVRISFAPLDQLLLKTGKKWQCLRDAGISPGIVDKMQHGGGHVDTRTIQRVCALLSCQPGDIMVYVPDQAEPGEISGTPGQDQPQT